MSTQVPNPRGFYYDSTSGKRYNGRLLRAAGMTENDPNVHVLYDERPLPSNPSVFYVQDSQDVELVDGSYFIKYEEKPLPRDQIVKNLSRDYAGAVEQKRNTAVEVGDGVVVLATDSAIQIIGALISTKLAGITFIPRTDFLVAGTLTDKTVEALTEYVDQLNLHRERCDELNGLIIPFLEEAEIDTLISTKAADWVNNNY